MALMQRGMNRGHRGDCENKICFLDRVDMLPTARLLGQNQERIFDQEVI